MSRNTRKKLEQPVEPQVETVQAVPAVEDIPLVAIALTRDNEGRIVVSTPGENTRIAGSDSALPEVLRQLGVDLINRNRI